MSKDKISVTCAVSGIVTSCRKEVYEKRLDKFGDEATLLSKYICNKAKASLRAGKTVEEIRKESQLAGIDVSGLGVVSEDVLLKYLPKTKKVTQTTKKE